MALTDQDGYIPLIANDKELYTDTTPPPEPKTNKLTFYSLYMHLLPYEEYPTKADEIKRQAKIVTDGLRVRDKILDEADAKVLGNISKGTIVNILEVKEDNASNNNCARVTIADNSGKITLTTTTKQTNSAGKEENVESITEVTPPADGFWIVLKEKQTANGKETWKEHATELPLPKREYPSYWAKQITAKVVPDEMNIRQAPAAGSDIAGATLTVKLKKNDEVIYDNNKVKTLKISGKDYRMAECKLTKDKEEFTKNGVTTFWACVESSYMTTTKAEPNSFDTVDTTNPVKISAGDPVGFLGLYETPTSATGGKSDKPKKQVHIEVFTTTDEAELKKLLDNEAGLTIGKQFIHIPKGAILQRNSPHKDAEQSKTVASLNDTWKDKQINTLATGFASYTSETAGSTGKKRMPKGLKLSILQVKDTTQKVGSASYHLAKAKVLEDIKADTKAQTDAYAKDEEIWFAAFSANKSITNSSNQNTNLFEDVTPEKTPATTPLSEEIKQLTETYYQTKQEHIIPPDRATLKNNYYQVIIYENKQSIPGYISEAKIQKISQYELAKLGFKIVKEEDTSKDGSVTTKTDGFVDQTDMSKFFQDICKEMDSKENGGDGDGKLSLPELRSALKDPVLSDKWSKLIAYHPTEWQAKGNDPKWNRLDTDILKGEANKALREHEKERITKLVFWDEGIADLAGKKQAFHFHPVAFVEHMGSTKLWHDPIDNPQLCLYSQGGGAKPWHGSFGEKIRDGANKHTGIDIFAKIGTPVYACVKSEVVTVAVSSSMFGGTICLKVLDNDTFKNKRNHSFEPKYSNKTEVAEGPKFSHDGELYCFYAHLSQMDVKVGDIVNAGDIIALSGTSGYNGKTFRTRNPHLHFEIRSTEGASGLNNKCNPCIYVDCKDDEMLSEEERRIQTEEAKEDRFQSHITTL